jgi:tripartite-type tricarboxylate transporter receptor subunit TctC
MSVDWGEAAARAPRIGCIARLPRSAAACRSPAVTRVRRPGAGVGVIPVRYPPSRQVPTVGDFLPGYEAGGWQGIGAPKNTPVEFIDKLNKEIRVGLTDPKIMSRITDLGGVALASSPAEFGRLISDEIEKFGNVIKFAGIKPE